MTAHSQPAAQAGESTSTPVGAGTPEHTSTQSGLHGTTRGPVQSRMGWSRPSAVTFSTGRAGTTCCDRPVAGWAELGSASAQHVLAYLRARKNERRTAGKAGGAQQRVGQGFG